MARIFLPLMAEAVSDLFDSARDEGFSPVNLIAIAILRAWSYASAATRRSRTWPWTRAPAPRSGAWIVAPLLLNSAGLNQGRPVSATVTPRLG